jgi:hypothetical protein
MPRSDFGQKVIFWAFCRQSSNFAALAQTELQADCLARYPELCATLGCRTRHGVGWRSPDPTRPGAVRDAGPAGPGTAWAGGAPTRVDLSDIVYGFGAADEPSAKGF